MRKFFAKYRKSRNLDTVCQESEAASANNAQKSNNADLKQDTNIEVMEVVICTFFFFLFICYKPLQIKNSYLLLLLLLLLD